LRTGPGTNTVVVGLSAAAVVVTVTAGAVVAVVADEAVVVGNVAVDDAPVVVVSDPAMVELGPAVLVGAALVDEASGATVVETVVDELWALDGAVELTPIPITAATAMLSRDKSGRRLAARTRVVFMMGSQERRSRGWLVPSCPTLPSNAGISGKKRQVNNN
jgi:hypothetical protein